MKEPKDIELLPRDLYDNEIEEILWNFGVVFEDPPLIRVKGSPNLEELDLNELDLLNLKQEIKENYQVVGYCTVENCYCSSVQLKKRGNHSFSDLLLKYKLISKKTYNSIKDRFSEKVFLEIGA